MNKILLSTAYFPTIEYFHYLSQVKLVLIEGHETYPKQTFRNRCNIYSPNGIQVLTIPVNKIDGNRTKTNKIQISDESNWRIHHWKSLQTAYNTSAFFMYYKDELWKRMQYQTNNLLEYNTYLLEYLMDEIGIKTSFSISETYQSEETDTLDLRTKINPKNKTIRNQAPAYYQVHKEKHGFLINLSILDLLFSEGPNTLNYLQSVKLS